jgi:hypothetical protein
MSRFLYKDPYYKFYTNYYKVTETAFLKGD